MQERTDDQDRHLCAICQAGFATSAELVRHERESHTQHGSATTPAPESQADGSAKPPRGGREFTRRNLE